MTINTILLAILCFATGNLLIEHLFPVNDAKNSTVHPPGLAAEHTSTKTSINPHTSSTLISKAQVPAANPVFNPKDLNRNWHLSDINPKTFENMADIDAVLHLNIPAPNAGDQAFYSFANTLQTITMGRRYSNSGITTPLLVAYVYLAKHSPNTAYKIFNEGKIDSRLFSHLVRFGYLPNWFKHINKANKLILTNKLMLRSLAMSYDDSFAKNLFKNAFFDADTTTNTVIDINNLIFSVDIMTEHEKQKIVSYLMEGKRKIDPRSVKSVFREGILPISETQALHLINNNAYNSSKSRSMASFFVDAAGFGDEAYFKLLIKDVVDNNKQPNHFYCAACGIALYGEGLLGAPLIDAVKHNKPLSVRKVASEYIIKAR